MTRKAYNLLENHSGLSHTTYSIKCILGFTLILLALLGNPGTARSQLPAHPWPMFGQNPQHTGRSLHVGPTIGERKWTQRIKGIVEGSPAIDSDGTIYVGSHDSNLYAIQPDGVIKWVFPTLDMIRGTPAIDSEGSIYIGSFDGCIYAVDKNGDLKWCYPTGGRVGSSPVIGADGTIYIGEHFGNLIALNPDGTLKWQIKAADAAITVSSPAIGADGTIYIGSYLRTGNKGMFYAVNPDGTIKWRLQTSGDIRATATISPEGVIYIGDRQGTLYALTPEGVVLWTFSAEDDFRSSPVMAQDGTIYVGSWDHNLYAINPDGSLKWSFTADGPIEATPVIDRDGTIYFPSFGGTYYAINNDGSLKWSLNEGFYYGSSAIGSDNTIYTSYDFFIMAIGQEGPQLPPIDLQRPSIKVFTNQDSYKLGDTLVMNVKVANQTNKIWTVELKTWIRLPDGKNLPVYQKDSISLAPGEIILREVYSHSFDGTEKQGIYMIGGRFLEPASSEYLDQHFKSIIFSP